MNAWDGMGWNSDNGDGPHVSRASTATKMTKKKKGNA